MLNKVFFNTIFNKSIFFSALFVVALFTLISSKAIAEPQPEFSEPDISKVIPLAADLSARLVYLQNHLGDLIVVTPLEAKISVIDSKVNEVAQQLQALKDSNDGNYISYFAIKQSINSELDLLKEISDSIAKSVKLVDKWENEWQAESINWQNWQTALLTDRSPEQLRLSLEEAIIIIDTAQELVLQNLSPLLEAQSKAARVLSKISILNNDVNELITETRIDSLLTNSPPLYSALYLSKFHAGLWDETLNGLKLLSWSENPFTERHAFNYALIFLFFIIFSVVVQRNIERFRESTNWCFIAQRPFATVLFVSATLIQLQLDLWETPKTIALLNIVIASIAGARILSYVIGEKRHQQAVYGVISAYIFTLILISSNMPSPLFRLYIFATSLIALLFSLRWNKEVKSNCGGEAHIYYKSLPVVIFLCLLVLLAQIFGQAGISLYIYKSSLISMVLVASISLFIYLIRGTLHWLFFSSPVWQIKLLRSDANHYVRSTSFMVKVALVLFVLIPGLLTAWDISESLPKAITMLFTPSFYIGEQQISVSLIIVTIASLYGTFFASKIIPKVLLDEKVNKRIIERGVRQSIAHLLQYLIVLIGILVSFTMMGFDLSKMTLLMGAFGVGIGFGLQSIVNNFVSGLILLFERPLREGDTIAVGDDIAQIKKIGLRATIVQTFENADVIIPNAELISNQVTNWTLNTRQVRVSINVGVAYGSNIEKVSKILLQCGKQHKSVVKSPTPQVIFINLGESSLDFELRVWIPDADERIHVKSDIYHDVISKFSEENITIPLPQRELRFHPQPDTSNEPKEDLKKEG